MSNVTTDQIAQQLGQLSAMELIGLTRRLEAEWGVTAAPSVVSLPQVGTTLSPGLVVEQTEFEVVLGAVPAPDKKIAVIKAVREITSLGLKEAKDLVEAAPKTLKEGVSGAEAREIAGKVTAAGGQAIVK